MQYEGIELPPCGIEGAAFICGEVFRRLAGLEWVIDYSGLWFVASSEVAICPLARIKELEYGGVPQFGRYILFLSRAAMDCLPFAGPETVAALRSLIAKDEDYIHDLQLAIDNARQSGRST